VRRNMPRRSGISRRQSATPVKRRNIYALTQTRNGRGCRNSQQVTTFGNRIVLGSYEVSDPRILAHPLMVLSPLLLEDIFLNIFNRLQPRHRENRHRIVRRNSSCDCWRFRYGQPGGYCNRPIIGYRTGRNLRIHFDAGMSQPEREAAQIMQAVDFTKVAEGDGYAIFGGLFHGDSSSSNNGRSAPRWEFNNISSSSSDRPCYDEETREWL
jgi:hypothetical protein